MKSIFESAIAHGGFDLAAMLGKIDAYHIEGKLTDIDRDELYEKARGGMQPQYDVTKEIENLWAAIKVLQNKHIDDVEPPEAVQPEEDVYPEYKQPTGAHDAYQVGAKITEGGKKYICKMPNTVYPPSIYPAAWESVD